MSVGGFPVNGTTTMRKKYIADIPTMLGIGSESVEGKALFFDLKTMLQKSTSTMIVHGSGQKEGVRNDEIGHIKSS